METSPDDFAALVRRVLDEEVFPWADDGPILPMARDALAKAVAVKLAAALG